MNKHLRRYIEDEIRSVEETKKEIKRMENDILYGSPSGEGSGGGGHSDVVATKAIVLVSNRALERMRLFVASFESVYEKLPNDKKKAIQLLYWSNRDLNCNGVGMEIGIDGSTVGRWRNDIIKCVAELMGYVTL